MRYVRFVLIPPNDGLYPIDQRLAADSGVTRTTIHTINLLDDETAVALYQLDGDAKRVEEILASSPETLAHSISATGETIHSYIHFDVTDTVAELLQIPHKTGIIIDTLIEYTRCGGLRMTVVGDHKTIQQAMAAVPDEIRLKLEETGEYKPSAGRLFAQLTPRQQETLKAAVDAGYYEVPRQATHADVAEALDRTGGTVGEHLRKIEAVVLSAVVP